MQPIVRGTSLSLIFAGTQPLLTGGRIMGTYKAAQAAERQSLSGYKADTNSTALKVREAYWDAAWYEAKLRVDTDYAKTKDWSSQNVKARVDEGKAPRVDYLREDAELSRARTQVNEDFRDYNVALVKLKTALGINYSSLFFLKDSLEYFEMPGDISGFLLSAGKNRPEIAQADSKIAELKARRMVARSKYAPQVNLYGLGSNITGSSPDGGGNGRWGGVVGVVGGVTLYDSGIRLNELRAADNAVRQAELARAEVRQKVAEDVSIAWINLDLSRKNVDLAKVEVVSAEEDQRLMHTRYLVGKAIELEDFDASVKLLQARLNLLQSIYKFRLAQARLIWASGER
jgi:outer membrane protein TolC